MLWLPGFYNITQGLVWNGQALSGLQDAVRFLGGISATRFLLVKACQKTYNQKAAWFSRLLLRVSKLPAPFVQITDITEKLPQVAATNFDDLLFVA
jgi:hypothetical protein